METLISAVPTSKTKSQSNQAGLALVEIIVALVLIAVIFTTVPLPSLDPESQNLEESVLDFQRAIRFSTDEAIIRNAIVRISINLDADPQTYGIEASDDPTLVLEESVDLEELSSSEREAYEAKQENMAKRFQLIPEFSDKEKEMPDGIYVLGLARAGGQSLRNTGKVHLYFYPSGEKEEALLFISSSSQLVYLDIPSFENSVGVDYTNYTELELRNIDLAQETKIKQIYDKWSR